MAPVGQIKSQSIKCCHNNIDFKYIKNVPKFADEEITNQNIINEVNKSSNLLNEKINNLKLDILDAFGGESFDEIKNVYGNLGRVEEIHMNHENAEASYNNNVLNRIASQQNTNFQNQILTSRINNIEQLLFNLQH
jgi:hypothetical protein